MGERLGGSPKVTQLAQPKPEPCLHVPNTLVLPALCPGALWEMHGKQAVPYSSTQAEGITACVREVTRVWNLQGGPRLASWQMHDFSPGQSYPRLPQAASWLQKKTPVLFPRPDSSGSIHLGVGRIGSQRPHDLAVLHAPSTRCHSKNMLSCWLPLNEDLISQGLG